MGEERVGFPSDFFFWLLFLFLLLPCSEERKCQRGGGCLMAVLFTSIQVRSKGGEKEELQDVGIYTLLSQILTFEYKKLVGLSCL